MSTIESIKPEDIEKRSFEIIEETLKAQGISASFLSESGKEMTWDEMRAGTVCAGGDAGLCKSIVYRCIHTTADTDYAASLRFSPGAADKLKGLLASGADIVTDTNMALSGINKKSLSLTGGRACCYMADEDVAGEAKKRGVTRAYVAMEKAFGLHKESGRPVVFAVGNAPTALISLCDLYRSKGFKPDFIIGVPVGFVNVVASKELVMDTDIPYIVNEGNKGGSTVAAAIVNAVLYAAGTRR